MGHRQQPKEDKKKICHVLDVSVMIILLATNANSLRLEWHFSKQICTMSFSICTNGSEPDQILLAPLAAPFMVGDFMYKLQACLWNI